MNEKEHEEYDDEVGYDDLYELSSWEFGFKYNMTDELIKYYIENSEEVIKRRKAFENK